MHPQELGFTCPSGAPAGRIDYIFASPLLVERLTYCDVLRTGEDGITGEQASDHLPVIVEFGLRVPSGAQDTMLNRVDSALVD
jgi:endonuclease/exonuclease/phosphatase family metal-dependent hydrolase